VAGLGQAMLDELGSHGGGVAGDPRRAPQSGEDVPHHQVVGPRSRFLLGTEQRAKRIQIVAKDARPIRRQDVHELAVAVVGKVKQIKLAGRIDVPRVVPEPIRDAVEQYARPDSARDRRVARRTNGGTTGVTSIAWP
jgi:hypothetical protein